MLFRDRGTFRSQFFALVPWWWFSVVLRGWRLISRAASRDGEAGAGGHRAHHRYIPAAFALFVAILADAAAVTVGAGRLMAHQ